MCEAVGVECHWASQEERGEETAEAWPALFAEVLIDHATMADE